MNGFPEQLVEFETNTGIILHTHTHVCVCVSVKERERERKREGEIKSMFFFVYQNVKDSTQPSSTEILFIYTGCLKIDATH